LNPFFGHYSNLFDDLFDFSGDKTIVPTWNLRDRILSQIFSAAQQPAVSVLSARLLPFITGAICRNHQSKGDLP